MAAVTICSDFGTQENIKSLTIPIVYPCICHEVMGPDAMILVFWMLSFKQAFSLSSFTFNKRLFSSSSFSAIRVMSSVICVSEVIDTSPNNLDSLLLFKKKMSWTSAPQPLLRCRSANREISFPADVATCRHLSQRHCDAPSVILREKNLLAAGKNDLQVKPFTGCAGALHMEERAGSCATCRPSDGRAGRSELHLERDILPTLPLPRVARIDKITNCINIPTSLLMTLVMPCSRHACFPAGHVPHPLEPQPKERESSAFYSTWKKSPLFHP